MKFVSSPDRDLLLSAKGHALVTGGPGCGKTTVALQKALKRINEGLVPGQKILFLSFSRAAVARIMEASRQDIPREARKSLEIQTFHSFCWQFVRGHGYLLGAPKPVRLLAPQDERSLRKGKKEYDPAWDAECERLFLERGLLVFDLFAPKALALLTRSNALRRLVAERYPLVIVDEAQDTGTDQWKCIEALAELTQLICLADLDQQIYDFRRDVSPERVDHILAALNPLRIDLGGQNNRSPGLEIVQFGNDILNGTPRGSAYQGVSQLGFIPEAAKRDVAIRRAIGILNQRILAETGAAPKSIGFLTNWGRGVAIAARALQGGSHPIPHFVLMDEAEVLLATRVVAFCLEPIADEWQSLAVGLELIAEVFQARGQMAKANTLRRGALAAREGRTRGAAKCPPALKEILDRLRSSSFTGEPATDWLLVRDMFLKSGVDELITIAGLVVYLMAFNRGRRIADLLSTTWLRLGCYEGAQATIEAAITEDQIVGAGGEFSGIGVMTMHKSKGKEFDGVIILHLGTLSPLSSDQELPPHRKSRRLLRVAITRARCHTLLLADLYTPSPLLTGHKLSIPRRTAKAA